MGGRRRRRRRSAKNSSFTTSQTPLPAHVDFLYQITWKLTTHGLENHPTIANACPPREF